MKYLVFTIIEGMADSATEYTAPTMAWAMAQELRRLDRGEDVEPGWLFAYPDEEDEHHYSFADHSAAFLLTFDSYVAEAM